MARPDPQPISSIAGIMSEIVRGWPDAFTSEAHAAYWRQEFERSIFAADLPYLERAWRIVMLTRTAAYFPRPGEIVKAIRDIRDTEPKNTTRDGKTRIPSPGPYVFERAPTIAHTYRATHPQLIDEARVAGWDIVLEQRIKDAAHDTAIAEFYTSYGHNLTDRGSYATRHVGDAWEPIVDARPPARQIVTSTTQATVDPHADAIARARASLAANTKEPETDRAADAEQK